MLDIYFKPNYGRIHETIESGECIVFKYQTEVGKIQNMFIKRKIPLQIDTESYYDLITPFDYGGPLITQCQPGKTQELVAGYEQSFKKYCRDNNIVSEFVRFHPLFPNAKDFSSCYNVIPARRTVATNLKAYEDPFMEEFTKSARKSIRRALRAGVGFRVVEQPANVDEFKSIYYSTMKRNKASDFYYFDDDYFQNCLLAFGDNIILVEAIFQDTVIAAGFYFVYKNFIHAHLSGTKTEYLHLSPAYIIKYATLLWAQKHGIDLIHYGGGITNRKNDSLYRFKSKFGKNSKFDFCIGKKIWNKAVYKQLCLKKGVNENRGFFPAYRANNS